MKEQYRRLYNDCVNLNTFKQDAHFVCIAGKNYFSNSIKLLVVGRAVNGWGSLPADNASVFGEAAEEQFHDETRWNWIESIDGVLYSVHGNEDVPLSKRYCISRSPFWSYTDEIWEQISETTISCDVWMENIAWTNLYKVSPKGSGNPTNEQYQAQLPACREILAEEIRSLKPTHILFLTDQNWFVDFQDCFPGYHLFGYSKNVCGFGKYAGAKFVVAKRPEYKDKSAFVKDVINSFEVSTCHGKVPQPAGTSIKCQYRP